MKKVGKSMASGGTCKSVNLGLAMRKAGTGVVSGKPRQPGKGTSYGRPGIP